MSWKWQDNIGANVPCPLFTFWKMRVVRSNTHCLLRGPGYEVKIFWMYVSCNIWFHSASFRATLGFKKHPSSTFTSVYHLMCVWGCYSAIKNKKKVSNQAYTKGTKKKKKNFCASPCEDGVWQRRWRDWMCLRSLVFCAVLKGQSLAVEIIVAKVFACGNQTVWRTDCALSRWITWRHVWVWSSTRGNRSWSMNSREICTFPCEFRIFTCTMNILKQILSYRG